MGQTALHVAIQEDHTMTSAVILETDKGLAEIKDNKEMTPLMYACRKGNIYIVKLLLDMLKKDQVEILDCDSLNCLDHAIDNGKEMIAVELLDQDNWRSLMTHASWSGRTRTTPMRKLIISMPGVCKFVLDKCITTQGMNEDIQLGDVEIKVDYELLDDEYSEWMRDDSNAGDIMMGKQIRDYMVMTNDLPGSRDNMEMDHEQVCSNFRIDGTLKVGAKIHFRDRLSRFSNHPVKLMINNDENKELLNHPVVRLMFREKHRQFRLVYWPRLVQHLTLLVFLTLHSLIIPPPYYVKQHLSGGNYTWLADGEAKWKEDLDSNALVLFGSIGTWYILVQTVVYFLEFTQYHTFGDSLAKSLTMLTGDIDFDTVFHPTDYLYQQSATEDFTNMVFYPNTTLVIFFIFLLFMPIVVMNLLTGLAVFDIDVVRKKKKILQGSLGEG
eukprot:XP_011683825.1 PREDICTED: uncharacterized protein LOC105447456 [Strongylocentrotus purpuratus]